MFEVFTLSRTSDIALTSNLCLPIPGHLPQLQKQENDAELTLPPFSTHPWSPPPAVQAGEGRRAAPTSLYPSLVTSLTEAEGAA